MSLTPPRAAPSAQDLRVWMGAVAADRDKAAFVRLFEYFAPRLIAFFSKGGLARDAAEEVVQETMIAVWNKAALYDPAQAGVATWVYTVARNCRIDRIRRDGRRSRVELENEPQEELEASGEDVLLAEERDRRIRAAVNALPPEQAAVVQLSFFADKPHSDIARELGIPLGTVKSRMRLAMAKIRAAWEPES